MAKDMRIVFETFLEKLSASVDDGDFRAALADVASSLDLLAFAYISLPPGSNGKPMLISNYPALWTARYLENRYQRVDPVIVRARSGESPFQWRVDSFDLSRPQLRLFEEAAQFGICCGVTIPIIDGCGNFAAVTFAADKPDPAYFRVAERYEQGLPLFASCFHTFVRRRLSGDRIVDGVLLTPREYECLQWAARGKSDWVIGRILGITRRTAAFHLGNARRKLGVTTTKQAIARLAGSGFSVP
ncbi:LuxR family transcriptional regulator [Mesorhizobium sp. LNHC221B00]|uniref:LuxR family transcriptional regulator n=1 Tax=Mesorhizobium sp. LNHC221B00 TaxID=1287233 RepID=UPI0004177BF9|nr:LuxR family transcriptional regulator [Mesorhizobium sp. LNHC221B00]